MGKFSKIFHHIESKDLRNKYEQKKDAKIKEEKKKKEFKQYLVSTMETKKYNWRESMTTSDVTVSREIDAAPGDGEVSSLNAIDPTSYTATGSVLTPGDEFPANVGTQIRTSGSGEGHGGFNVGGMYLAFQGTGTGDGNARFAVLSAVDSTNVDTLQIRAIVGNDSNGGEDPDEAGEELYVMYKTPAMPEAMFLIQKPDGSIAPGITGTEDQIIPLGAAPSSGLNDYSLTIPDYARAAGTQFILIQPINSGEGFDNYGVTEIKFQRKSPIAVFVPLDNPEASSFIRSAPPKSTSTPKKRKKAVDDKLQASDDYTASKFGDEFPGREVRVGGEDPFASAKIGDDVKPSPQGKDEVKKAFDASRLKSALGKPESKPTTSPEEKLADILKTTPKPDQPTTVKDLSTFKKNADDKKTEVAVATEAKNSVKNSPEISEIIKGMTAEQKKAAIEKMYPEKAQEILNAADNNVVTAALEEVVSATIVDSIADITQPLIGAKTAANAFNEYNTFLGKVAKDPNTPGSTYENPVNMSNQITKGDMNDLTTTINSGNYQSIVNSIRATEDKDVQNRLKKELEAMISDTIGNNFGLDNFMHNNVKVNLPHLLETGKTKLTKGYKFTTGGSIEGVENATSWDDGWFYGAKLISDALGLEYDTLGTGKVPFPQTFNVGGITVAPGNIVNIPVWTATTFGPAIIAKLGLTNTKNFDNSSYKSPMMYYEIDVPGKYSVDKKGNPIQSEKPSAAEKIKQTVSNVLNQGKEVVSNLFSFGAEDENAPQREDFPMGRSGAKKYSDAMKLYNAAKSVSEASNKPYVEPQLDPNQKFGMRDYGYGLSPTDLTPEASDLPVIPPSEEVAALIAAAETGGDAEIDALAKAHAKMMEKHYEQMYKAEAEGASPESLSALSVRQYLARKPLEDALEIDSPVPPMPSEPIEPQREDYPNTRSGAKQYQDAKKAFDAEQASKEISELSNDDAQNRVFDIFDQDYDTASALYDPLFENDPVYKEYMGIYDEMERNATPAGQELLKQQYEALEFTLQGYASEFVDTVLVQPGAMNPFGYENTSNQALTYAGKKDAPAGVYYWDKSEREQFEDAGIDLVKYDEARALLDKLANDFDYSPFKFTEAQPEYIEAKTEQDRLEGIYSASNNTSKSAWARYEAHADKYAGREFDLRFEKSEYERIKARAEELYAEYEEAENKALDDQRAFLDANNKRSDIFTKIYKQVDDASDFDRSVKEKRIEYWDNYEQELKSKMEAIKSKINGDYDYNEDLRALDPQIEELFNRINKQFLMLYNNRDNILEPEGTFDDDGNYYPPGFDPDDVIGTDEIGKPEFDPFKDEIKPGLDAEDGDDLALLDGGGSILAAILALGLAIKGGQTIMDVYKKHKEKIDKKIKEMEALGSVSQYTGGDATAAATAAASTNIASAGVNYDLYNWYVKTYGAGAAGWYHNNPGSDPSNNPFLRPGSYVPKAQKNGKSNTMVAHFVPRGKNLSEEMLVKKTKIQRPKQFFKEPNQFFNVNDIKPEFPENPPPKLDPNTGKHPEYGKKANRYKKLDPISANSMPPTGDPEIDAVVNKQKTINKIKKMARNK